MMKSSVFEAIGLVQSPPSGLASVSNLDLPEAASGSSAPPQRADFELTKIDNGFWRLRVLTQRGNAWMRANQPVAENEELTLSLQGANSFLSRARVQGLRTECINSAGRSLI